MGVKIGGIEIEGIKFSYSVDAEALISQLKNFDKVKFQKYFLNNIPVGSANIRNYITEVLYKEELILREAKRIEEGKIKGQKLKEGEKDGSQRK